MFRYCCDIRAIVADLGLEADIGLEVTQCLLRGPFRP